MGNSNSTDVERLKQLYSMNNIQLESLRRDLNEQKRINQQQEQHYKNLIGNLLQKQNGIRDKIPENQYNKVNDFLEGVNRDIDSKSSPVTNWKPGEKSTKNTQQNYQSQQTPQNYQSQQTPQNYQNPQNTSQNYQNPQTPQNRQRNYDDIKKSENEIDPYALYELKKGQPFSLNALKDKYKEYAYKTHPDNGGSARNFAIVTNAYKYLIEEHKKMENDKQFNQLKSASVGFLETQSKSGVMNRDLGGGNFNVNRFNQVFQENKLEDPSNEGYNNWIKDNQYKTEDIRRDTSITNGNFNTQFDSRVEVGKELQLYTVPQVLNSSTSGNVQELGVERVENYSGESGSGGGKIKYTDLKEAHTTSRLVDPNAKYKQYRSINELEGARANMGEMSREEQNLIEEMEINRNREQTRREENQRRMDRMFSTHHDKIHNIFLGGTNAN